MNRFVKPRFLLIGIMLIALAVRLPFLNGSFWLDEAGQVMEGLRPLSQQLHITKDFQPPLFHLIVFAFLQFTKLEWELRLASMIPALVTIVLTYLVGIEITKKSSERSSRQNGVGLMAALLLSLSAFHVFYSQELRQYVLTACWGVASWYALINMLKEQGFHQKKWQILFVLTTLGGFYTMYVYPFLTLAQLVYLYWRERKHLKKTIVLVGIAAVFFLPWLPGFLDQLRVGTTLQHSLPGWAEVVSTPQWKALPLTWLKLLGGGKAIDFTWMDVLYFGIPTISIAILWLKTRRSIHPVLWFWAGFSVLGAWLISFIIPILQPKRVLFALPAVYLAVSQAIFSLKSKKLQYVLIGGAVCYQLLGLAFLWTAPSLQREDWRSTISQLHAQFSPNDTIAVFGFTEPFAPWNFYELRAQPPFPTIAFPKIPVLVIGEVEQYMQPALRYKHVLVFDYLRDLTDPHRLIEQWLEAHDYKGIASLDTKNMGFIRVYERLDQKNSPQKNLALPVPPSVPPPFYTLKNQVQ